MTRLTKDLRDNIAAHAVAHAFNPKLEALKKEGDALGREAYASIFPAAELKAAGRGFGNGRHMRNLFEKAIRKHAVRLCTRKREWTKEELSELTIEDLS